MRSSSQGVDRKPTIWRSWIGPHASDARKTDIGGLENGFTADRQFLPSPRRRSGRCRFGALADRLAEDEDPALVCVMAANNETGVLQPVREVADIAHAHGASCFVMQCRPPVRLKLISPWDVDTWRFRRTRWAARRASACWSVAMCATRSLLTGGGQEHGLRAGTRMLPALSGSLSPPRLPRIHG